MVKGILFSTDMVRAILDGRKTVTRRCVKQSVWENFVCEKGKAINYLDRKTNILEGPIYRAPYQIGDTLYIHEKWNFAYDLDDGDKIVEDTGRYIYYADASMPFSEWVDPDTGEHKEKMPWRPCIHMPKEAARIWLKVTDVRVERLQDITEEQVYREGVIKGHDDYSGRDYWYYKEGQDYLTGKVWTDSAKQCFLWGLWDSTIKKSDIARYGWDANPWVWVIEFERCGKPEEEA